MLERIFRCVYSHYFQAIIAVFGVEFVQVRCCPLAVNARVGPEINECDFSAQIGESWLVLGVKVTRAARYFRGRATVLQFFFVGSACADRPTGGGGNNIVLRTLTNGLLDPFRIVRDCALQLSGNVEYQPDRQGD